MLNKPDHHCSAVGILNLTTDSFSRDGLVHEAMGREEIIARALNLAQTFVVAGCRMLDIGGESTRPGYKDIPIATEIERTVPVIYALKAKFPQIELSIDTSKSAVAKEAIKAGVHIVNDVTALTGDEKMGETIAQAQQMGNSLRVVLMHNASQQKAFSQDQKIGATYESFDHNTSQEIFLQNITKDLRNIITYAQEQGIEKQSIIVDPGIGFGKTLAQNLILLANIKRLKETFALPIYIGASRKSFIGKILDRSVNERLFGSLGVVAVTAMSGARYIRVHDVTETIDVIRMVEAISQFATPA